MMYKFADDTSVVGLIKNGGEADYRREVEENISKTKEMVVDFRKVSSPVSPLYINGEAVERVASFKFLGTTIHESLSLDLNSGIIISKSHQRLHFLQQLEKFRVSQAAMNHIFIGPP